METTASKTNEYAFLCEKLELSVSEAEANNLTLAELKDLYEGYQQLFLIYV